MSAKRRKPPLLKIGCKFLLAQQKASNQEHDRAEAQGKTGSDTATKQKNIYS